MTDFAYMASKVVGAAIRIETLLILLLGLSLLAFWRGRNRMAAGCLGGGLGFLILLAVFPLGDVVLAPLEGQYPANPKVGNVAGIIVLGGGEEPVRSAALGRPMLGESGDRFMAAISLAHRFPESQVLFTGWTGKKGDTGGKGPIEDLFLEAGITRERLLLEPRARNTAENAVYSKALVPKQGQGRWILVTSAWHMPRAVETFCYAGWKNLSPWPADYRALAFSKRIDWDLARNLEDFNTGLKEWVGIAAYRLMGRSTAQLADRCLR